MTLFKSSPLSIFARALLPVLIAFAASSSFAQEKLILIGGGPNRPAAALKQFGDWAGQENGRILIVTWASSIPNEVAKALIRDFSKQFRGQIDVSLVPPKTERQQQAFLKKLARSNGVFFSGGDQNKIMQAFQQEGGESLRLSLSEAYKSGKVFGGTSAGTAVMSQHMIMGDPEKGVVPLAPGLGFLPDSMIVDQHFSQRNRTGRLLQAQFQIQSQYQAAVPYAVGIDEDTALVLINKEIAWSLGNHRVRVFEKSKSSHVVNEIPFPSGYSWKVSGFQNRCSGIYK